MDEATACTLPLHKYVYAKAKREVEALCVEAARGGLPVMIVNPAEVYGPEDTSLITACNLIDFAKSSPVMICTGGTSVVHVDDVARGIIAALEKGKPGERYILGGENLTIKQLAELTLELLGQKKAIWTLPNGLIRTVAKVGGALRIPLPFNPAVIPYATLFWFADNAKARRELGVTFRSARETLAPTVAWLRESGRV
jgi:dihydroflavonol-4-reductase